MLRKQIVCLGLLGCLAGCDGKDTPSSEVDAGEDKTVTVGEVVILGSPNSDDLSSYRWEQLSPQQQVSFIDGFGADQPQPRIYIDDSLAGEAILFELTATNAEDKASSDAVTLTVPVCSEEPGVIFGDCVQRPWIGPVSYDNAKELLHVNGQDKSLHAQWKVIPSDDNPDDSILDIQLSGDEAVSDVAFHVAPPEFAHDLNDIYAEFQTIDLTEYSDGIFSFDIRVLAAPFGMTGTTVTLQCTWPCRSAFLPVDQFTNIVEDEWLTVKIPVAELLKDNGNDEHPNLDLTKVDKIVIAPPAFMDEQRGYHYQLNNIQLEKSDDLQIFDDAINAKAWSQPIGYDQALDETYEDGSRADVHMNWNIESGDALQVDVMNIRYSEGDTFGAFSIRTVDDTGAFSPADFNVIKGAELVFDVNIVASPYNEVGIFVTMECVLPCRSGFVRVKGFGDTPVGEWSTVRIPVSAFLEDNGDDMAPNLDLSQLDNIVFGPGWNGDEQKGFNFKLDNIRFEL